MLFFLAALKHNFRNMFFFLSFLCIFIWACTQSTINTPATLGKIPNDQVHLTNLMNATVGFVEQDQGRVNSPTFCSGFYVTPDVIISAAHCFRESIRVEIGDRVLTLRSPADIVGQEVHFIFKHEYDNSDSLREVEPHAGTIVRTDFAHDLVAIYSATPSPYVVRLATRMPRIGEKVYGIGHPSGMGWSFSEGIVSRTLVRFNRLLIVQATTQLAGGCSGGPLFNEDGELFGVADAFVNNLPHLGIFIGTHYVSKIMMEPQRHAQTSVTDQLDAGTAARY